MTLVDRVRGHLVTEGLVRVPNVPGPGARPWLPPAWRHPDNGAIAPGDARDQGRPPTAQDDGLVISIFFAPGIAPSAGEEERRRDGVDIVMRATDVPSIVAFDAGVRRALLGDPPAPGGRTDWVMDGLYVIQSVQWRPFQPIDAANEVFTFTVGYLFETRAV